MTVLQLLVFEEKGLLALEHSDPRLSPRVLRYAGRGEVALGEEPWDHQQRFVFPQRLLAVCQPELLAPLRHLLLQLLLCLGAAGHLLERRDQHVPELRA